MREKSLQEKIDHVAALLKQARHAVIFTGAGVSTESGVPDFRSPGGIWETFNQDAFDYSSFINYEGARREHWRLFKRLNAGVLPNPAHYAVARLCEAGYVKTVITQNVDNLHQQAGVEPGRVLELHGSLQHFTCLGCSCRLSLEVVEPLMQKSEVPDCPECSGILKPDVVFFGEPLPQGVIQRAVEESRSSDLFIVIGSTLTVYPAALMPEYGLSSGATLIIINLSPTPMDGKAEVVVHEKAGEIMPHIAGAAGCSI